MEQRLEKLHSAPDWIRFIMTALLGCCGGILFYSLSIPVGAMLGAIIAVILASSLGLPTLFPQGVRKFLLMMLGVMFGERVTPETLHSLWLWPGSLTVLTLSVIAGVLLSYRATRKRGWDHDTSILAALPGALSAVVAITIQRNADLNKVMISQLMRLFGLIFLTPVIVYLSGHSEDAANLVRLSNKEPIFSLPVLIFILNLLVVVVIVWLLKRFSLTGIEILVGFLLTASTHGSGLITETSPSWVFFVASLFLGSMIGDRARNTNLKALREYFSDSMTIIAWTMLSTFAGISICYLGLGLDPVLVFVAFAPGGFEAMLVLGLSLGLNPTFVIVHHLVRFFGIVIAAPMIFRSKN